jgi:hypothetical protein
METLQQAAVPPIGWFVIFLGLVLVLVSPRWLFGLAVFSIPFSATAVVNFGSPDADLDTNAFGVQATIFLGGLWIARELVVRIRTRDFSFPRSLRTTAWLLVLFMSIAFVSLAMPAIIDGRFVVRTEASDSFTPLVPSFQQLTQFAYLAYGLIFALFAAARSIDRHWLRTTVRAYVAGAVALALWGWMQFVVVTTGHTYPDGILNTNVHPAAQGHVEELHLSVGSIHRISSAAMEPSMFAQVLLIAVAFLSVLALNGRSLYSRPLDKYALVVVVSVLVLSAATTAYVGLVLLLILLFPTVARRTRRTRYAIAAAGALIAASLLYALVPLIRAVIDDTVFAKAQTWSAAERLGTVTDAWWHFVEYPFLGTGWGTAPSHDLAVYLLANVGVVGLAAFLALVIHLLRQLHRATHAVRPASRTDVAYASAAQVALVLMLVLNALTGFAFVFGHVWLVIAVAAACAALAGASQETSAEPGARIRTRTRRRPAVDAALRPEVDLPRPGR